MNTSLTFGENIFFNKLYLNLSIGTPPQCVPFRLQVSNTNLYATDRFYYSNISSSFENNGVAMNYGDVLNGWHGKETLDLKIKKYNKDEATNFGKIKFVYSEKDMKLGSLGLKMPDIYQEISISFLNSLTQANYTKNTVWTLKFYDTENLQNSITTNFINDSHKDIENINKVKNIITTSNPIGELIIGGDPHEYEDNHNFYPEKEYYKVYVRPQETKLFLDMYFHIVYFNNTSNLVDNYIQGEVRAELNPEISYIVGTDAYYKAIKNNFFDKYEYLSNGICEQKNIYDNKNYFFIQCDSDESKFSLKDFPSVYFEQKELQTIFVLDAKDVFVLDKINQKYVFLIYFYGIRKAWWTIGLPFLKKYQLTFDEGRKMKKKKKKINNNNKNDNKNLKKQNWIKYWLIIGFGIILAALMIFLGMIIQKYYCNPIRKVRANELDEDCLYESESKGINNNE